MQDIIKAHTCRFNDELQVRECFVEGAKRLLQVLINREEEALKEKNYPVEYGIDGAWENAKQDTINNLKTLQDSLK